MGTDGGAEGSELISTIVVDEEEPARELLRALLRQWPQIQIVGEAAHGESAIQMMIALRLRAGVGAEHRPGRIYKAAVEELLSPSMPP